MKHTKLILSALALAAPLAIVGCSGGNNSNSIPSSTDPNIRAATFIGLKIGGTSLVSFRGDAPSAATNVSITGLPNGVSLRGIDSRVAPRAVDAATGANGVAAIYALGSNNQLYTLTVNGNTATASAVGSPAVFTNFTLNNGAYGFDVNPAADRLRVVSGTQNSRINPNNGAAVDGDAAAAGVNPDGNLAYDSADANAGRTPNITAAGYTNNDNDVATGTINYGIDTDRDILVTQGRPASATTPLVSPNTGILFTVGALGVDLPNDAGLEVFGPSNTAVATGGRNFYSVNLATGALLNIGTIGGGADIIDITVAIP